MKAFETITNEVLGHVGGGYDKAKAHSEGERGAALGMWPGAIIGGSIGGITSGVAGGWGGTMLGGLAGAGIGYSIGYGKTAWQTRGQ